MNVFSWWVFGSHEPLNSLVSPAEGPTLSAVLESDVPEKYTLSKHLWGYLQNYAKKHQAAGNGFGCSVFTGDDVARTLSARYHKDGSEILISQGPRRSPRRLTPRECSRLMGFPRNFKIPVSDTQAYRQFGNSVVVPVVQRIAKQVSSTLNQPTLSAPLFKLTPFEAPRRNKMVSLVLPLSFHNTGIAHRD